MENKLTDKLSFSTIEKSTRIIYLFNKKNKIKKGRAPISGVFLISGIYCLLRMQSYFYYILPDLANKSYSESSVKFNFLILMICVLSVINLNLKTKRYNEINFKFENLRENLIKCVSENFCECKENCNCKEEYLKYMKETENINLIY